MTFPMNKSQINDLTCEFNALELQGLNLEASTEYK